MVSVDDNEDSAPSPYAGLADRIRSGKTASQIEFENRPPELTIVRPPQERMGRGIVKSIVFAYRNANAAAIYTVFINEQPVGQLAPGDRISITVPKGRVVVVVKAFTLSSNAIELDVKNGDRVELKCNAKFAGLILYR